MKCAACVSFDPSAWYFEHEQTYPGPQMKAKLWTTDKCQEADPPGWGWGIVRFRSFVVDELLKSSDLKISGPDACVEFPLI